MEIKVDAEDVNKVVAEAIVKSARGQQLEKSVNEHLGEVVSGFQSPLKKLCEQHVMDAIRTVLNRDYKDKIIAMIAERLNEEHLDEIVSASVDKAMDLLRDSNRGY